MRKSTWAVLLILLIVTAAVVALAALRQPAPRNPAGQTSIESLPIGSSSPDESKVVAFIGDSYTAGAGGNGTKWTSALSRSKRWREVNLGKGGTGYRANAGRDGCGEDYCPSFVEMVPRAIAAHPDIVVVAGGRNDGDADVGAASEDLMKHLRAGAPRARVIVLSPMWDASPYPDSLRKMGRTLQSNAAKTGCEYVEIGSPLNGKPDLVSGDGVHPNARGYEALGAAAAQAIK